MQNGWIKLWRKSLNSPSFKNPVLWHFWEYCLLKASHKEKIVIVGFQQIQLLPGQFIYGRQKAATETGLSERNCRTCLHNLEKSKKLTIKVTNKFSIISIINWDIYQGSDIDTDQQTDQQVTSNRPASDQQVTTYKNVENVKNEKKTKQLSASGDAANEEIFYLTRKKRKLSGKRLESFERFWKDFAYFKGKAEAADSWMDIPELTNALVDKICERARLEAKSRPQKIQEGLTPKMGQGWLAGKRWEDEKYTPFSAPIEKSPEKEKEPCEICNGSGMIGYYFISGNDYPETSRGKKFHAFCGCGHCGNINPKFMNEKHLKLDQIRGNGWTPDCDCKVEEIKQIKNIIHGMPTKLSFEDKKQIALEKARRLENETKEKNA